MQKRLRVEKRRTQRITQPSRLVSKEFFFPSSSRSHGSKEPQQEPFEESGQGNNFSSGKTSKLTEKAPIKAPVAGAFAARPSGPTQFRKFYERGDFPIALDHDTKGNKIAWKVLVLQQRLTCRSTWTSWTITIIFPSSSMGFARQSTHTNSLRCRA